MSSETSTVSALLRRGRFERPLRGCAVWRYYDPQTGQFISVDPLVDGTTAAYSYAADDPTNAVDPTGLCGRSAQVAVTLAAVLPEQGDDGGDEAIDCVPLQIHNLGDGRIVIIELCFRLDGSTFVRERVVYEEDTLPPDLSSLLRPAPRPKRSALPTRPRPRKQALLAL